MDHGTGTSTTSMYLSNMVPTQTPAKTIQTSVLRRTGTGARKGGSIKYPGGFRFGNHTALVSYPGGFGF